MSPHDRKVRFTYEHPDLGDDPRPDPVADADKALTKLIAAKLERAWPGHFFKVVVSHAQGTILINLPPLMMEPNWMKVSIVRLWTDPGMKCIVNAAGEILERYRLPTSRWTTDQFYSAVRSIPVLKRRNATVPA